MPYSGTPAALFLLLACGPVVQLTPQGGRVQLALEVPAALLQDYAPVGTGQRIVRKRYHERWPRVRVIPA